jgi:hypothetical protein
LVIHVVCQSWMKTELCQLAWWAAGMASKVFGTWPGGFWALGIW